MSQINQNLTNIVKKQQNSSEKQLRQFVQNFYSKVRSYERTQFDPIMSTGATHEGKKLLPKLLTFVSNQRQELDLSAGSWVIDGTPILAEQCNWNHDKTEMLFEIIHNKQRLNGHLIFSHHGMRVNGLLEIQGMAYGVGFRIKPQTYHLNIANGGAYIDGPSGTLMWDQNSDDWEDADWDTSGDGLDFTFGVEETEIIFGETDNEFTCSFRDRNTGEEWVPIEGQGTTGTMDGLMTVNFTAGPDYEFYREMSELYPFSLRLQFDIFATECVGAMSRDPHPEDGRANAITGLWSRNNIAGSYQLHDIDHLLTVSGDALYINSKKLPQGHWRGLSYIWEKLPEEFRELGIPEQGQIVFSPCGDNIISSNFTKGGQRVHPDQHLKAPNTFEPVSKQKLGSSDPLSVVELKNMTQFVKNEAGQYYDALQQKSMSDFYGILQYYMDDEDCKTFFNPNPAPLPFEVSAIAKMVGEKGTKPEDFYRNLSMAYTVSTLANSEMDGADLLNGVRAGRWIKKQTTVSDVMQVQSPALYNRHYRHKYPRLSLYLQDQIDNAQEHVSNISGETERRIATALENIAPEDNEGLEEITNSLEKMGEYAKTNKTYWAFVMFGYYSSPTFLNIMQNCVSDPSNDGSLYTQQLNRGLALLNALDTGGFFAEQLVSTLRAFNLSSLLPQLADYGANVDDFRYAVDSIFRAFVDEYINSTDPKMREAAENLKKNGDQETIDKLLEIMRETSMTSSGLFQWTSFAMRFEKNCQKVFSKLAKGMSDLFLMAMASYTMCLLFGGGVKWSDLTGTQKAMIIGNGTIMFSQMTWMVVKRGMKVPLMFAPGTNPTGWTRFKAFFKSPRGGEALARGEIEQIQGLKGWLMGRSEASMANGDAMRILFSEGAENEALLQKGLSKTERIFGRNLQEFMATRIGAVLSVVGIVFSAIGLSRAEDPLETAYEALFLTASIFEFFATAGAWACQALAIETIGGFAVSSLCTLASVCGAVAFVAGAVLLCILLFGHHDSPIVTFAKKKAGVYYKPKKYDIDDLQQYQPLDQDQRTGVTISTHATHGKVMTINDEGHIDCDKYDGTGRSAFYLSVDEFGLASFGAPIVRQDGSKVMRVLGVDEGDSLVATTSNIDPEAVQLQQWVAEPVADGVYNKSGDNSYLQGGTFTFYNLSIFKRTGKKAYLEYKDKWQLSDTAEHINISMVVTEPEGLSMANIRWHSSEYNMFQSPVLQVLGSRVRKWCITPTLPEDLSFDDTSGQVSMKQGQRAKPFARSSFTIMVLNGVGGDETIFDLEILSSS